MRNALPHSRRVAILASALELFRSRGFHAVGIDEIGTAAGISGPGVYRHFPSKHSLLCAIFDTISERMLDAAREIALKTTVSPSETLERLVGLHVSFASQERALLAVWIQDWRSLPEPDRNRLRSRYVEYVGEWARCLGAVRPELTHDELETIVYAGISAINSVALHDSKLDRATVDPILQRLALAVLRA